jgi:Ca2+-binding RTX toxin-like protein
VRLFPDSMRRFGRRVSLQSVGSTLLLAGCLTIAPASLADAGGPTCGGKQATIVSSAAEIVGTKAPDVIVAGTGDDVIYAAGGNDVICGSDGNDTIYSERGNDTVFGEAGDDTIYSERGSDDLDGGSGEDRAFGETGNDTLSGGPSNGDNVDGGPGDDTVSGGPGDFDIVTGGVGNDHIDGGPGAHDVASYRGAGGPITVNLGSGTVTGAEDERLTGIEDALGGSANDTLTGAVEAPNRLDGGPGGDRMVAAGSGDQAFGGPGDDMCDGPLASEDSCGPADGGSGTAVELYESIADTSSLVIAGSEGADNVIVSRSADGYMVHSQAGGVQVRLGDRDSNACTSDPATNSISCHGDPTSVLASLAGGNDALTIADSVPVGISATIDGGPGGDTLHGGAGNDTIYGGDDHEPDTLEGGEGDDVLFGVNIAHPQRDSGAAGMSGGPGDDLLVGGQPCDGDLFDGGPGENDSASFARVRNSGTFVMATIGDSVLDPDIAGCNAGRIEQSVEKIEGSPGPDVLAGDSGPNVLLGRGGDDSLDGSGGSDDCIGGEGSDRATSCKLTASIP